MAVENTDFSFFFKRLEGKDKKKKRLWRRLGSVGLPWKRRFRLHLWLVDGFLFKIISVLETVLLVSELCVYYLCCGCHI
ncbi:hypothetical protein HanIR_Chr01g0025991 [Helianthus annuus]|nr:hypothetical protein HanIR_Chr01g0025991 [Helianthus annuus]